MRDILRKTRVRRVVLYRLHGRLRCGCGNRYRFFFFFPVAVGIGARVRLVDVDLGNLVQLLEQLVDALYPLVGLDGKTAAEDVLKGRVDLNTQL